MSGSLRVPARARTEQCALAVISQSSYNLNVVSRRLVEQGSSRALLAPGLLERRSQGNPSHQRRGVRRSANERRSAKFTEEVSTQRTPTVSAFYCVKSLET